MSCDIDSPNGASGLVTTRPCTPPVQCSKKSEFQELRHGERQRKSRERQVSPRQPQRRQTEHETEGKANNASDWQRQRVVHVGVFHQDRRRVGADRVERALAERELAASAGQDVQRQHRKPVDQQHRQLEDDEVLDEQRYETQRGQHHQRGAEAKRHGAFRNGFDGRGFCDDVFSSAHDQTRFTMGRPSSPAGLTTNTTMISASAIGSFSSLPTPGM